MTAHAQTHRIQCNSAFSARVADRFQRLLPHLYFSGRCGPADTYALWPETAGGLFRAVTLALAGVLLAVFAPSPARAEFSVCNQTLDVVNVAVGQEHGTVFRTEGWWTIGSNQCARVIRDDLLTRYIYVFATDVFGQTLLDGTVSMCVDAEKFVIEGIDSCWRRGYRETKFYEVDTRAQDRWTLFLSAPPDN